MTPSTEHSHLLFFWSVHLCLDKFFLPALGRSFNPARYITEEAEITDAYDSHKANNKTTARITNLWGGISDPTFAFWSKVSLFLSTTNQIITYIFTTFAIVPIRPIVLSHRSSSASLSIICCA